MTNSKKIMAVLWAAGWAMSVPAYAADAALDYRILATSKTSTMEKELNEAAAAGFRFSKAMGENPRTADRKSSSPW